MTETNHASPELGLELFRCRPKSIWSWLKARHRGILPMPNHINLLGIFQVAASPILNNFLFAGIPFVMLVFLTQNVVGLQQPNEPTWYRAFMMASLVTMISISIWWYWVAPRQDCLIVYERGFRWRIWLSRFGLFPSRGTVVIDTLDAFSYRSDSTQEEPVEMGETLEGGLARIRLEVSLSRYDMALYFKSGNKAILGHILSRFDKEDIQQFLAHIAKDAKANCIHVRN